MRTRIFAASLLILVVAMALFYSYRVQTATLVVTVHLYLSVGRESNAVPGFGWILEQNTSVSLIKWPQIATEKMDVNPEYAFSETRTTPVHFAVTFCLDQTNKTLMTPDLTTTGSYSAVASSHFANINQGTHNLVITLYVLGFEKNENHMRRLLTIP